MIGGWYVYAIENNKAKRLAILAGPFDAQWKATEKITSVKAEASHWKNGPDAFYGVCEFYAPKLYSGVFNAKLWINAKGIWK